MRKSKVILLSIIIAMTGVFAGSEAMEMIRKSKGEFRFEDYDSPEEARAVLLEMHPVGSSVDDLVKTLEGAGATIESEIILNEKNKKIYNKSPIGAVGAASYFYNQTGFLPGLSSYKWGGGIPYDKDRKILAIGVSKHYMGL